MIKTISKAQQHYDPTSCQMTGVKRGQPRVIRPPKYLDIFVTTKLKRKVRRLNKLKYSDLVSFQHSPLHIDNEEPFETNLRQDLLKTVELFG